ncbi:tyrosine--tRNA ligase [Candidatus Woesearchaeota archaeon]|nr:tyrosine--tRNA ligase [Candidatus Woesearchaeota archaeon]
MDLQKKIDLIKEVGEEIITEEELVQLFQTKDRPIAYDGFEPSGRIHIAQGILRALNTNALTQAGCNFTFLVADWHAWANNKLGGNLEKIQIAGNYFVEVWKSCGMDLSKVKFVYANDLVTDRDYWKKVMSIARISTVKRILRCGQIMGREEGEMLQASQILYPCMQAADIFHLEADIAQLGMDQRKVNMLAREVAPKLGFSKPLSISHHMLMGLTTQPTTSESAVERAIHLKMSKSKPETAIFMTDSEQSIKEKITKAHCPPQEVEENPILDYAKHLVFRKYGVLKIERPQKFGGTCEFDTFSSLAKDYAEGTLHPLDLKNAVAFYVNDMVKPVRDHFEKNKKARALLEQVQSFEVTR